eukprot:4971700-Amphidinium_carterae.3
MGLVDKRSKGSEVTGSRTTGNGLPNGADSLESDRAATYCSVAGTFFLYLSLDRPAMQIGTTYLFQDHDWHEFTNGSRLATFDGSTNKTAQGRYQSTYSLFQTTQEMSRERAPILFMSFLANTSWIQVQANATDCTLDR